MGDEIPYKAFTTKSSGLLGKLANMVDILYSDKTVSVLALWDTGATATCISTDVVEVLGLIPIGKRTIQTPSGQGIVNTYNVNILLPNDVYIADIVVSDSSIGSQGLGALIGMDIIRRGDFSVSNYNGQTTFSFRVPSQRTTDYVKEINLNNIVGPRHGKGKRNKSKH